MPGGCSEDKCCKVPVCLEFTSATATEDFKEDMKAILREILEDLCGGEGDECCPDTPVVRGKIEMCLNGRTLNVSKNACEGILTAGGTCGPCTPTILNLEMVKEEDLE